MTHKAQFLVDTAGLFGGSESRFELHTEAKLTDMELSDPGLESAVVNGRLELDLVTKAFGTHWFR